MAPKTTSHSKSKTTEVKNALQSSVQSQFNQAYVSSAGNGQYQIDATLSGQAREVVKSAVINRASQILCRKGYVVQVTCDSTAPGKADYVFEFNTEKGRERYSVGVNMDTDRASYLLKKIIGK